MFGEAVLYWVGAASLLLMAMAMMVLGGTLWMHQRRIRQLAARRDTHDRWRPILFEQAVVAAERDLPELTEREIDSFSELWLAVYETLRGPARKRLIALAQALNMESQLRYRLLNADIDSRLTAMLMLGYLGDEPSRPRLLRLLSDANTVNSLCAARALMAIDVEQGLQAVAPCLGRTDWSPGRIASLLEPVDPEVLQPLLVAQIPGATSLQAVRILRVLRILAPAGYDPAIEQALLHQPDDAEVLSASLASMQTIRWRETVRSQCSHPVWHVRVQAVQALGRVGLEEDLPLLLNCLADDNWWVRLRAARACLRLPGVSRADLMQRAAALDDRFARETLLQAMRRDLEKTA